MIRYTLLTSPYLTSPVLFEHSINPWDSIFIHELYLPSTLSKRFKCSYSHPFFSLSCILIIDGIQAIKKHLKEVDNVPLLVSLFTDSTSSRIREMVEIFKDHGEVVMCVGSSCRLQNNSIFQVSDLAVAVATLPGDKQQIPVDISDLINRFPVYYGKSNRDIASKLAHNNNNNNNYSNNNINNSSNIDGDMSNINIDSDNNNHNKYNNNNNNNNNTKKLNTTPHSSCLCRDDLLLHSRLIGLGTSPLLQLPPVLASSVYMQNDNAKNVSHSSYCAINRKSNNVNGNRDDNNNNNDNNNSNNNDNNKNNYESRNENLNRLKLSALLEGIHMGRVYLVNSLQACAFLAVSCLSLALWPLTACALPLSLPPSLPPPMALLFLFLYIPLLSFSILFGPGPDGIMKATPRKNPKIKNLKNSKSSLWSNKNEKNSEMEIFSESENLIFQQQRDRKSKDESRFFRYLLTRCMYTSFSLFVAGWLACGEIFSTPKMSPKGTRGQDYER